MMCTTSTISDIACVYWVCMRLMIVMMVITDQLLYCFAGEALIGARAYRVIFALVSLPLATVALVYFINHRYDGTPLWNVRGVPGVHEAVWAMNFISFYFLYPSTFNILEVSGALVGKTSHALLLPACVLFVRSPFAVHYSLCTQFHLPYKLHKLDNINC